MNLLFGNLTGSSLSPCSTIWQPRCGRAGAIPLEGFRSHSAFLVADHSVDSWFSWHMSHLRCSLPKIQHPKSWVLTFPMIDLQNLGNVSKGFGEPKCLLLFWFSANCLRMAKVWSHWWSLFPVCYWVWFVGNCELSRHRYLSGLEPRSCWASRPSWNEHSLTPNSEIPAEQLGREGSSIPRPFTFLYPELSALSHWPECATSVSASVAMALSLVPCLLAVILPLNLETDFHSNLVLYFFLIQILWMIFLCLLLVAYHSEKHI